jgi:hypothetical protein
MKYTLTFFYVMFVVKAKLAAVMRAEVFRNGFGQFSAETVSDVFADLITASISGATLPLGVGFRLANDICKRLLH